MKKLLLLLIIPFLSFGQGWEQTYDYDDDEGWDVKQTSDGGYIISGHTYTSELNIDGRALLIKTDENGNQQWMKTFLGEDNGIAYSRSVQEASDGGYIICATSTFNLSMGRDVILIKTDENGNQQWMKNYNYCNVFGPAFCYESLTEIDPVVNKTNDGGYIIAVTQLDENGDVITVNDKYVGLIKTDGNGNLEWYKSFGEIGSGDEFFAKSVQQTNDGGYIITGDVKYYTNFTYNWDLYLIKTDENGNESLFEIYSNYGIETGWSIKQSEDEGYIIAGVVDDGDGNNENVLFRKIDESLNTIEWTQTFGGVGLENGYSFDITNEGGYVITGDIVTPNSNSFDVYLIKTDENGEEEWSRVIGQDEENEFGRTVKQTNDGGYIIAGTKGDDILLIKTDSEGNVTFTNIIETPAIKKNLITTVDILGRETTNNQGFQLHIYDDGTVEKKYVIK